MPYTQITARYSGFQGAPGYIRMKFTGALTTAEANAAAANWKTFLSSIAVYGPSGSSITFDTAAQEYTDLGVQTGEVSITSVPTPINPVSSAAYAGGSGAVINWLTNGFHLGRKVRGRTFLVPLTSSAFEANGTLINGVVTSITAAGATFATSTPQPVIVSIKTGPGGVTSGFVSPIVGASVPDRSAILRSRRD
jgi:hypothetical protein